MLATIGKLFIKLLGGTRNERIVRSLMGVARGPIASAEEELAGQYDQLVREAAAEAGQDPDQMSAAASALEVVPLAAIDWLRGKTAEFRRRLARGESAEDLLPEVSAVVRFASWLALDHRQFDVQLVAGQVLHQGSVAEEATGEGKTFACYPAVYLSALAGNKVHVVTVNDYLVRRDRDLAAKVFHLLDMRVGAIQELMDSPARHEQYACQIIYGTNSQFGFDYLRDNMALSVEDQVQVRRNYAIIDEVDNILIDEARTPLIISGPAAGNVDRYAKADAVAREVIKRQQPCEQAERRVDGLKRTVKALEGELAKEAGKKRDAVAKKLQKARQELEQAESVLMTRSKFYEVELDKKAVHLTHAGVSAAQEMAGVGSFYVGSNMEWPHLLDQALRAHVVYERDKDYVVRDRDVIIVDEFTGRLMEGRQWSDGLHQAVEAKERVPIKEENQTMATITIQNFFKLYDKLAGMTGTAMTEADEFMKIYELDVVAVPTNRPVNRMDYEDRIYGTVEEKYDAIVEEINFHSKAGRPVLVGTTSIEKSEKLSEMLTHRYGIKHEVLNARPENAAREAEIVALAGQQHALKPGSKRSKMAGNVTLATNMAGRGTDIKLAPAVVNETCKVPSAERLAELGVAPQALFPPGSTKCCLYCPEYDPATNCAHCFKPKLDPSFPQRGRTSCRESVPCGLHIVGTERHEARRIDNQLRGRSGRQGDPGSSRFFLSLRDDLLAIFAGEWTLKVLGWLGLQNGQAIEDKRVSRGIARAQKKVEQRNFDIRKNLLEYDEVMDYQRKVFYTRRQQILEGAGIQAVIEEMIRETIYESARDYLAEDYTRRCVAEWARQNLQVSVGPEQIRGEALEDLELIESDLRELAKEEAASTITMTLGEYADPATDRKEWDLRGLASWAMSRFRINVSQNQLRRMTYEEIEKALIEGASAYVDQMDLSPLQRYLEAGSGCRALLEWARSKFGVELTPDEIPAQEPDLAAEKILAAVRGVYLRREIEYPAEYAVDITVGRSGPDNAYALETLCEWVNRKYRANWTAEDLAGKSVEEIRDGVVALAEQFLSGGRLEETVDAFLAGTGGEPPSTQAVADWAKERFDSELTDEQLRAGDVRDVLIESGRAFLRRELTELERFVLIQIHDSSWVDHLLAMDHLKDSIGLRGYAEQDPKIAYKREGFRQFEHMLSSVREKVTDLVFKARLGAEAEMVSAYRVTDLVHEQLTAYDQAAREMAARQAGAGAQKVQTIIRQQPKVGRNDPCPCGSGKKYKKCCGRNL